MLLVLIRLSIGGSSDFVVRSGWTDDYVCLFKVSTPNSIISLACRVHDEIAVARQLLLLMLLADNHGVDN